MEHQDRKQLLEWGTIVLALLIIAAGAIYVRHFYHAPIAVEKEALPADTLPDRFPADIPLEADAGVTQNYIASAPGVPFQATREFTTHRSVAENFSLYQSFFSSGSWAVVHAANASSYATILAANRALNIQASVLIADNAAAGERAVNITITGLRTAEESPATSSTTP